MGVVGCALKEGSTEEAQDTDVVHSVTQWPSFPWAPASPWHMVVNVDIVPAHQSPWSRLRVCGSFLECSPGHPSGRFCRRPRPAEHKCLQRIGPVASEVVYFSVQLLKPVASGCCCPVRHVGDCVGAVGRGCRARPPSTGPKEVPPHIFIPPCARRVVLEPWRRPALQEWQTVHVLAWLTVPQEGMADVDSGV